MKELTAGMTKPFKTFFLLVLIPVSALPAGPGSTRAVGAVAADPTLLLAYGFQGQVSSTEKAYWSSGFGKLK